MLKRVIFAAAHAGFAGMGLPMGGGAAMAERLAGEWAQLGRWPLDILGAGPHSLAGTHYRQIAPPMGKDLTCLSELEYARFCQSFGGQVTAYLQSAHRQEKVVAVLNDLAEGPDFRALGSSGLPMVTLFHVDVVDYFCRIYLRGLVKPERLAGWYDWICRHGGERLVPTLLRLVLGQQRDAVTASRALVVPSRGMADVLRRCYPGVPAERIHIIPWGCWKEAPSPEAIAAARESLLQQCSPLHHPVLLILSRISPEKGHDVLMNALRIYEKKGGRPLTVMIAGAAAYMKGKAFLRGVRKQARSLVRSRVHFTGYADAATKEALFSLADLYVHPARHESYGLTLCEAMAAGLPVLTSDHYSARDLVKPGSGWIVPGGSPMALAEAIHRACGSQAALEHLLSIRSSFPPPRSFSQTALQLADLIESAADC